MSGLLLLQQDAHLNTDTNVWGELGWSARNWNGYSVCRNDEKAVVLQWLTEQGYEDTGDGCHYRKFQDQEVSQVQEVDYHIDWPDGEPF